MPYTALVTGATSGMGLEYCRQLAAMGHNVVMVSNQADLLSTLPPALSAEFGVAAIGRYQDLAAADAADELFRWCRSQHLEIDILISNAGSFFFHELTPEYHAKADLMLQLHAHTPTRLCMLFGEEMKRRGSGFIIIVSSLAADLPFPGITVYNATKAYLKNFAKSLYFEMRPYGVGVTSVIPGAIATPLYGLKPSLMELGVKAGIIMRPAWLVRRALRGMFHHRRVVRPGASNYYMPPMLRLLPSSIEAKLWRRLKNTLCQ